MTLDDFFTLTEMNNGLTAPSRVRELMAVMEKERNCVVKNAADSTRQWSAVASAIVATENKECVDLFLQLDGLNFISKWLKDAQKLDDDTSGSFVEESLTHLLRALEKLDVDHEKLLASGVWETVKNLLMHSSSRVQDKARALFESWKTKMNSTTSLPDVDKTGPSTVDEPQKSGDIERGIEHSESLPTDASICQENPINTKTPESDDPVLSTSSNDALNHQKVESANNMDTSLNLPIGNDASFHQVVSSPLQASSTEPPCHPDKTTSEPCVAAVPGEGATESLSDKMGLLETSKGGSFISSSVVVQEKKTITESPQKNSFDEGFSCTDSKEIDSDAKDVKYGEDGLNQHKASPISKAGVNSNPLLLPRSSNSEKSWGSPNDLEKFISGTEGKGKINTSGLHVTENDLANSYAFGRKLMDRGPERAGKKSDVDIDHGILDPLEYAMQVAMEVEREVVDDKERSCGSSEKLPEGNIRQPKSPDSVSQKQPHCSEGSPKEVVDEPNLSDASSPMQDESATSSGHQDAEQTNGTQDMATSQVAEVAQEEAHEEKGLGGFDLNEEVCPEDPERPENQCFAPVSFVSASRAAAAPGQPGAPLQFEGNLGWKGSAVTSAFRPASPRRMRESDKDLSTGGSSSSSKQRQGFLDFDLNVAESVDPKTGDWAADKHLQLYSTVVSGESSAETSSRKSEHLALDLNHSSEDGGPLLDWRTGQFFPQERGHHTQSHSLISSKQTARDINLNDQPTHLNDSSVITYLSPASQTFNVSGGNKSDDSVISIMGKRVEVNRKDFVSHIPNLANGPSQEQLPFEVNLGRTTGNLLGIGSAPTYSNSPGYGFNSFAPGPPLPFPSTMYGSGAPIPYMMDSRGQPVFPQVVGSASALPPAFSQPPFLVNLNTSNPSNGVGPSRSSVDLNSGMLLESGSKDPAGFGLFLNSAQVRSVEEQSRPNSVYSGKRKEPENGWEHFPFGHCTPPWK
ncbi:uncharacterized protein LOC125222106 [Salvia hispanica]|uniref:uncharacterized protein LOC125222106 n=1 Tax=Salvia hispanica TaxID=49212 RepID=UPI002008F8BD|nr:uncharacterized protein LOC125222106 [Salvia hispanica]